MSKKLYNPALKMRIFFELTTESPQAGGFPEYGIGSLNALLMLKYYQPNPMSPSPG
jgi:hypothetical protein